MLVGIVSGVVIVVGCLLIVRANRSIMPDFSGYDALQVTCPGFVNETIPVEFTGNGADRSPEIVLGNLTDDTVSIAVIMDDLDHPIMPGYNHWTIWNIEPQSSIPEGVAHGKRVPELGAAMQGVGYGRHCYRGPKPPFGSHRYRYHVFALDRRLDLAPDSGKKELLQAMEGHILQYGSVTGEYPGDGGR